MREINPTTKTPGGIVGKKKSKTPPEHGAGFPVATRLQ